MLHYLVDFEETAFDRNDDGKIVLGQIAAVCECGWVSSTFENEDMAIAAHQGHRERIGAEPLL